MTRGLQRATFNRSALVGVLSDVDRQVADPTYDFGERLGQWLDLSDALTLYSALNADAGSGAGAPSAAGDLPAELVLVRRKLGDSIENNGVFGADAAATPARIAFPVPPSDRGAESAADFTPYHRYYLAHQRDMDAAIAGLRANARQALAARSAAGRQLAGLDAAFEKSLANRERALLANIPVLLSKRFGQRYADHRAALAAGSADDPATWTRPGSWLEAFCHDLQTVLLAELELRLKPVAGLIAALGDVGDKTGTKAQ